MATQQDGPPIRTQFRGEGEAGVNWNWIKWFQSVAANVSKLFPATTPATANSPGNPGQWSYDTNYVYFCVAKDTWRRAAILPW